MQKIIITLFVIFSVGVQAQTQKINSFKLQDVTLLPGVFKDAQTTDLNYILALNPDRLLAPFLREAGFEPKAENYPNWENTGLDGHIGGHYITALSLMYASTGDEQVLIRLNYMLDELKKCQDKNGNGYVGGVPGSKALWDEVTNGNLDIGPFSVNKKWVPLYNIHKIFAGLHDAWLYAGSEKAKNMLIALSNWMLNVTAKLSETQMQTLLGSEHGGLNETFANVYAITGEKKYLELATRFSHKKILEPLAHKEDKLNGLHANTQIPKIIGFERISELNGDSAYHSAARFFWETVVNHRTCVIGGNSVREHFHPANDFSSMITSEQGPETCNTYNMLKLTKLLYQAEGDESYIDYYERALYNHILSTQQPEKGGFVYFTPMRPGHYRVYSQPQTSMWCCVGSGMENHAKYNELIYAYAQGKLFVNLFIPSKLNWKDQAVTLTQTTRFPEEETSELLIETKKQSKFALNIRYPNWVTAKAPIITVNGNPIDIKTQPGSYISIERTWKNGDKVKITLPMHTTVENLPDGSNHVAILHGPIVLAAKTDTANLTGLFADDSRGGHVAAGKQYPLNEMPMFVTGSKNIASFIRPVASKPLTFSAAELIYQPKYKNLELIPFYKLHNSRYVIYWQLETPESVKIFEQEQKKAEEMIQRIATATIDLVVAGEQQPESDHFIESEKSITGVHMNRHWRSATGWFSYKMNDKEKLASKLQVTYFGRDNNRKFKIYINEQAIAEVNLDGSNGENFFTVDYLIPSNIVRQSNGFLTVKFEANAGSTTAGVYEVRLLK